jgi:hypothetical protein
MKISKYISYKESVTSQTAIRHNVKNIPSDKEILNMQIVGLRVFDKVREHFGKPIKVSSFFRSVELNNLVKGSKSSQHTKGQAIDMIGTNGLTNSEIFNYIKDNLDFDQLIWEYGNKKNPAWVHVSYRIDAKNRKQILFVK